MAFPQHHSGLKIIGTIVLIVIVAAIALSFAGGIPTISSNKTITLQHNASANFYLPDSRNVSSIFLAQSSNSSATVYISRNPVLLNSITQISLTKGETTNISLSGGNADLQITLISGTSKAATIALSYVPKTLGIKSSSGIGSLNNTGGGQVKASTTESTTIPNAPTTTAAATTTVVQENPTVEAYAVANATSLGILMSDYKALYEKDKTDCTRSIYDSAYADNFGVVPTGPNTFANMSLIAPVSIKMSAASAGGDLFNISYYDVNVSGVEAKDRILQMQINITGQYVVSSDFSGDFYGMSYTSVLQQYQSLNSSSDLCSAYVA